MSGLGTCVFVLQFCVMKESRIPACNDTHRPKEMTLEVDGALVAPSKSSVLGHQTTAASWLKCFWVDALDFLQSHM